MAKTKRNRAKGKKGSAGKMVPLNPWLPAVPVKRKGKAALKLVLAIPLAVMASTAFALPVPARTLAVPAELSRRVISLPEFDRSVIAAKDRLLRKFEDKAVFAAAARGKGK